MNQTFLAIAPFDERKKGPVKEIAHAVQLDACGVNGGHGDSNRRSFRDRHTSVKSKQDVEFALFRFGLQLFNEFDGIAGLCGQMKTLGHGLRIPADSKLDTLTLLQLLLGGKTVVDEPLSVYAIIDNRRLRERIGRKDGTGHVRLGVTKSVGQPRAARIDRLRVVQPFRHVAVNIGVKCGLEFNCAADRPKTTLFPVRWLATRQAGFLQLGTKRVDRLIQQEHRLIVTVGVLPSKEKLDGSPLFHARRGRSKCQSGSDERAKHQRTNSFMARLKPSALRAMIASSTLQLRRT